MYLSVVVVGSNENHSGDFLGRMQGCVNSLLRGFAKFHINAEIVLVEGGTPAPNKLLTEAIDWSLATVPIRAIMVSRQFIKDRISNPNNVGFWETWMKNIGIRRTRGRFVLAINADSAYSDDTMWFLAKEGLDERCFYRCDRVDWTHEKRYRMLEDGTFWGDDAPPEGHAFETHMANGSFIPGEPYVGISKTGAPYAPNMLHFNASGEFMLMSREKWFEIHGMPEVDYWSTTDGQTVWLAATHGLTQVILPWPAIHPKHPKSDTKPIEWSDGKPWAVKNGEEWGFRDEVFPEILLGGPGEVNLIVNYDGQETKFTRSCLDGRNEDALENHIHFHGTFYEQPLLEYIRSLNIKGNYADIGAHIGNHSVFFAKFCPSDIIYSFEPRSDIFKTLLANLELNGITNCIAKNIGLSDQAGQMKFASPDDRNNSGNTHGYPLSQEVRDAPTNQPAFIVETIPLDNLNLDIKVAKIDVEEMEFEVLQGAKETLKNVDHLFVEMRNDDCSSEVFERNQKIIAFLRDQGLTFIQNFESMIRYFSRVK